MATSWSHLIWLSHSARIHVVTDLVGPIQKNGHNESRQLGNKPAPKSTAVELAQREGAALQASMLAQRYETGTLSKGLFKTKLAVFLPVPFSDSSAPVVKKKKKKKTAAEE